VSAWTRRPKLLVGSLLAAVALVTVVTVALASSSDDPPVDAVLSDARTLNQQPSPDDPSLGNAALVGDRFPVDAVVTDAEGTELTTATLLGRPLVVNFWFSTCAPCAKELPAFAEVHAARGDEVRFVGINPNDPVDVMERFAGVRGVAYELYRDPFAEVTDSIRAAAFPITLFVTPDGTIIEQTGPLDAEELDVHIDHLLEVSA
jgi:thiol-disulfide isomerase/thioredoxin